MHYLSGSALLVGITFLLYMTRQVVSEEAYKKADATLDSQRSRSSKI